MTVARDKGLGPLARDEQAATHLDGDDLGRVGATHHTGGERRTDAPMDGAGLAIHEHVRLDPAHTVDEGHGAEGRR